MSEIFYPHMFSPVKVGNVLLKNRFYASQSSPHSAQGPENYPAEGYMRHYINKAKNGAAYVTMTVGMDIDTPPPVLRGFNPRCMPGHFPTIDIQNSQVQNYLCQLSDAIHFYDSKASIMIGAIQPYGTDVDDGAIPFKVMGDGGAAGFAEAPGVRITEKQIKEMIERMALGAAIMQDCGYDMCYLHSAYRLELPARFLSKRTNTRDDDFGGSMENRCRFLFMICDRIKERCGKDFPIEVSFTAFDDEDPDPEKHWTLDDTREFVNLAKGHIDILQVRPHSVEYVHNIGLDSRLPTAEAARVAYEAANGEILISSVTGYCHPDLAENALGPDGYLDLVGMSRSFITNPHWQEYCKEGRGKDIVPCIKCNKCHRNSFAANHMAVCSVNPLYGKEHRIDYLKVEPKKKKNIAIVGGGPAGMRAAMFATENGHKVNLFEKKGELGGLLNINKYCDIKWPIHEYNEWLKARTMENPNITVHLNTEATKEMLQQGNYDEIFAAIGGTHMVPKIPGIDKNHVFYAADIYGAEEKVGQNVVIIGGGDIGVETGLHLTSKGRNVFVIEMMEELMRDAAPIHFRSRFVEAWEKDNHFNFAVNATCTEIRDDGVVYKDADGEHFIKADTVLYSVGMKAKQEEALDLYWLGKQIHLIGDCLTPGCIQTCNRDAYNAANTL
ncbi:MAG: FAD-dependent oxidoreductase [Agathobacter sp.]